MAEINEFPPVPDFYSRPHSFFAFVIDGEVTWIHTVPNEIEHLIAVLQSDPKIIEIPSDMTKEVSMGWKYDGNSFTRGE